MEVNLRAHLSSPIHREMNRLAPLSEEPIDEQDGRNVNRNRRRTTTTGSGGGGGRWWRNWIRNQVSSIICCGKKSNGLNVLLSVLGCPLFPVSLRPNSLIHASSINQVSSSSEYIIEHFAAATGCRKLKGRVKNMFATGKLMMEMTDEVSSGSGVKGLGERGCFVMWEMIPNKWLIELSVGGHSIVAGSDGNVAWRHTPWLGSHAAKGALRPLRRAFQGLDPLAISEVFSTAQYMGEKQIMVVDCFVLKLSANQIDLAERSDNTAEMIKHAIYGYFCQRRGLLVYLEDSSLTRIQSPGSHPMYWETTMSTKIGDYRSVDGVMIAHSGETNVLITRFGDHFKTGPTITRLREIWSIDDVAFNVPGLSIDSFIPPRQVQIDHRSTFDMAT